MDGQQRMVENKRVLVWDLPIRLFHWLLAVLVIAAWQTAENHLMALHRYCGYGVLVLVLFRIYWGFAGSTTARFSSFVRGPGAVLSYMGKLFKRGTNNIVGHNPMGGVSVLLMLGLLLAQTILGLFSVDTDGLESGPLASHVTFNTGRAAAHWHETVFNLLFLVILLHLAAVLFYRFYKRENLVGAMVTGSKEWPAGTPAPALRFATARHALIALVVSIAAVAVIIRL